VNQAGVKVASYGYDAYGAVTDAQVEPGLKNNRLFTGRELDADSGWQYNRARYYLAGLGGWNREDPENTRSHLGNLDSAVVRSRFGYSGLPTVDVDPTGCITFSSSTGGSVMAAVGGGTSGIPSSDA
jgi:RHS repeat-associated protein